MNGSDIEVPVFITGVKLPDPNRGKRKLTDKQALEIYRSKKPWKVLCMDYGISYMTIKAIKTRKHYKNIHQGEQNGMAK